MLTYRPGEGEYWIGLYTNNPRPGQKTGWFWLDGTHYDDTMDLWGPSEPAGGSYDNCVRLRNSNRAWFDMSCLLSYRYICKHGKYIVNMWTLMYFTFLNGILFKYWHIGYVFTIACYCYWWWYHFIAIHFTTIHFTTVNFTTINCTNVTSIT